VHVGLDGEVRPVEDGVEVGDRGARPGAPALSELIPADTVLAAGVEVGVLREAAGRGRLEERLGEGISGPAVGDGQRTTGPVVLVRAAFVVLGTLEVGEELVERPSAEAPAVVVGPVAADVDHRVDR
jgi:hypothetical protein